MSIQNISVSIGLDERLCNGKEDGAMMLFLLVCAHFLADYPLQGDFLALNKARTGPGYVPWWHALTAHAFIHGGFVALITGYWCIGGLVSQRHSCMPLPII